MSHQNFILNYFCLIRPTVEGVHGRDFKRGPWCYTTDPNTRYEYCDIPNCNRVNQTINLALQCGVSPTFYQGTTLLPNGAKNLRSRTDRRTNRILYGSDTKEKMLPWQVKLHGPHGCGGTLVTMQVSSSYCHTLVQHCMKPSSI